MKKAIVLLTGLVTLLSMGAAPARASGTPRMLVANFSLADEQYEVGVVEQGNTEIVAQMMIEMLGADGFRLEATKEYLKTYDELLEVSRKEANDPPEIAGTVENMGDYDVVFLGYPIWWGDVPQIIREFLSDYMGTRDSDILRRQARKALAGLGRSRLRPSTEDVAFENF